MFAGDMIHHNMNWIKTKLKQGWKWLTALFIGGVIVAQVVGFPPIVLNSEVKVISALETYQSSFLATNGKYRQFLNKQGLIDSGLNIDIPFEIQIDEYGSTKGQGYQVILTRTTITDTGVISSKSAETVKSIIKETKSVGYGSEAQSRTWNWRQK